MMVESFLANGPARNGGDRYQVVVNVDADVLADDADGVCELDDGPSLAAETARRLMCDASILVVTDGKGGRVEIGKKAPAIPRATRRAVRRRDQGCRFPGCGARVFTHVHHIRHRAHHGTNDLTNLVELCWHHHRLVHEGGWNLRLDTNGEVLAIRPNGNVLPRVRPVHLRSARNRARQLPTRHHHRPDHLHPALVRRPPRPRPHRHRLALRRSTHLRRLTAYAMTRSISSMLRRPRATRLSATWRMVSMPSSTARFWMSRLGARSTIRRLIPSVIGMISNRGRRPR